MVREVEGGTPGRESRLQARLERLVDHMEWANRRALRVVRETGEPGSLELLAHVLATERVWMERIRTGDCSGVEIWPDLTADECEARMEENLERYRAFARSVSREGLRREAAYANSSGESFETPVAEILLHVALHGSYHRGQIARELREAGEEPVNTDFIQFVRTAPGGAE
ncbi:MAG: DinB family protein [Gemmatimonadota bacterium]